jgi:murein DD-endopeptidase MepM/ murein hydrolase activator NlpD
VDDRSEGRVEPRRRGIRHTLERGETIWDLAQTVQVSAAEIMAANRLDAAGVTALREGQAVFIPGVTEDRRGRVQTRPMSPRQRRATTVARRLGLGTVAVAGKLLHGRVERRWARAAGSAERLPGTLRWPVTNGWFVRGFGSGEGGYHQAVDIMGEIGWNVRAAAPGIVAYAGDQVRGYGNMVIVVHPGGWVTMYAHNSVNFVVAGERVERGSVLAEVGSTGISRGPHVHFELIHEGRNCDPASLFRPGVRRRDGVVTATAQTVWRNADEPPDEIVCHRRRRHPRSRWVMHE